MRLHKKAVTDNYMRARTSAQCLLACLLAFSDSATNSENTLNSFERGRMPDLWEEEEIRDGYYRSTRGGKGEIGRTPAKAYAHRHAEVVMFPGSDTRIPTLKATWRPESRRHKFRPPSGSPNILPICFCVRMASGSEKRRHGNW